MNINEIAKLSEVSRATVSRYLNEGYVSEEKKERIRKVIEQTGYQPSTQAQNMRRKITKIIGVIIPRIQSESVSRMVAGISNVLAENGYQMLLANTKNDTKEELKYLKLFDKNRVDGILFMGTMFSKAHYRIMEELEVPIVVVGQQVPHFSCVYQDDYHAAYDVTKALLEHGKRPGYLGVTVEDKAAGEDRKCGYVDALENEKFKVRQQVMLEAEFGVASGYEKMRELLGIDETIDSVFCATDSIAVGALKYLRDQHIQVPEQIQLIGFGDTQMGSVVSPAITTIHYYYKTSGMEAARLLLEIISTGEDLKKEIKMGYKLIRQETLRG